MLADYLQTMGDPTTAGPVLPWVPPDAMLQRWTSDFDSKRDPRELLREVIKGSNHLHHPHYVGHQVTSPLPMTGLFSLVSSLLNNGSAVYEMGMVASAMERRALQWMACRLGYSEDADGVLTSGGSAGNLTALLAARQAKAGFDVWHEGQSSGPPLAVLVSDQAHYCIKRSAQIMGWGDDGVILIPSDAQYRMRTDLLEDALQAAKGKGRKVIAVVGSACSTATGAMDPLVAIADFAARHDLWFHVDGAHGASFVLAPEWKRKLQGIERADSVVWDAHKMLMTPALITAVLFRQGKHSYESFAQSASYLFGDAHAARDNWYDFGLRTLECTKNMMGFVLYASLATHGEAYFADYVTSMGKLAQDFAQVLRESSDFELAVEPDANIVCFRYKGRAGDEASDSVQEGIRNRLVASGHFYLVQTRLRGRLYLRTTLINPTTRLDHLRELLDAIRS
jgi:L-2,4-diaminobutyrate decarboxylase